MLRIIGLCVAGLLLASCAAQGPQSSDKTSELTGLRFMARYEAGGATAAEIVAWHAPSATAFVINGHDKTVDLVPFKDLAASSTLAASVKLSLVEESATAGVEFGDVTSVAVSPDQNLVAVAIQATDYGKDGCVLLLDASGKVVQAVPAGVQPDMLTFSPDGKTLLVANEGEARGGYGPGIADPAGSVSVIAIDQGKARLVANAGFAGFDAEQLKSAGILVQSQRDADGKILSLLNPEFDFEPEYIAVSPDSRFAWISLQEASAIAKLNIGEARFEWVKALPAKDYAKTGNELDALEDKKAALKSEPVFGLLMPDAVAVYSAGGKTYLVTANEGDAREWPLLSDGEPDEKNPAFYKNEIKAGKIKESQIDPSMPQAQKDLLVLAREKDNPYANLVIHAEKSRNAAGLFDRLYLFGGRSFSILDAKTLELIYDSGSQLEKTSTDRYPDAFNASNDNVKIDSRSAKKGPEPEGLDVASFGGKTYAFVGLERQGGIAVFDITQPADSRFVAYENSRDFGADVKGDSGPEGLRWVGAGESPTKTPLLLVANEVSGTLAVFEVLLK